MQIDTAVGRRPSSARVSSTVRATASAIDSLFLSLSLCLGDSEAHSEEYRPSVLGQTSLFSRLCRACKREKKRRVFSSYCFRLDEECAARARPGKSHVPLRGGVARFPAILKKATQSPLKVLTQGPRRARDRCVVVSLSLSLSPSRAVEIGTKGARVCVFLLIVLR